MQTKLNNFNLIHSPEEFLNSGFLKDLEKPECWSKIPLLNYTPLHQLKDMSIVRFRGMIQDMQDPEIYLERYEVKNTNDDTTRLQDGKYRDCLVLKATDGEHVNYDSKQNVQGERRTLFVVSIPGINDWAREYEEQCNRQNIPNLDNVVESRSAHVVPKKRLASSVEEDANHLEHAMDHDGPNGGMQMVDGDTSSTKVSANESNKRLCIHKTEEDKENGPKLERSSTLGMDYHLNSPIPERPSKACMIKLYADFDAYSLNTIVDVVGFLSVNPALDASTMDVDECVDFNLTEMQAQNPPPSLIPRLHAVAVHKLPHYNPLMDERLLVPPSTVIDPTDCNFNMLSVQKELRTLLTLCLLNDNLAADYLLSHLISTVYSRADMQSIGKFTLNVCNLPKEVLDSYTKQLYEILELLIPASHYLPMTLETMNTAAFTPKKDYETNKLVSGILQLAPHTHLVLDETHLQQGKVEASGVLAIQSIAHLINHQQIKCNFQYYDIEYNADVPVLVLSEGRSMLPHDFTVPLEVDGDSIKLFAETFKAARHYLQQSSRLEQFRRFLTRAKTSTFTMNPDDSEMIQTDFVEMRKTNTLSSANDLHGLLVFSRLLAIAHGKDQLDRESWQLAKDMESKRRQRVQNLPKSRRFTTPAPRTQ